MNSSGVEPEPFGKEYHLVHENSTYSSTPQVGMFAPVSQATLRRRAYALGDQAISGRSTVAEVQYYHFLIRVSDSRKWHHPDYASLAHEHGVSERTVQRYDKKFVALGLIELVPVGRNYHRKVLGLHPEMPETQDETPETIDTQEQSHTTAVSCDETISHDSSVAFNTILLSCSSTNSVKDGNNDGGMPPGGNGGGGNNNRRKLKSFMTFDGVPDTEAVRRLRAFDDGKFAASSLIAVSGKSLAEVEAAIEFVMAQGDKALDPKGFVISILKSPDGIYARKRGVPRQSAWEPRIVQENGVERLVCPLSLPGERHFSDECNGECRTPVWMRELYAAAD